MFRHFLHIPFPEEMEDDEWAEAWQQVNWLTKEGLLAPKSDGV